MLQISPQRAGTDREDHVVDGGAFDFGLDPPEIVEPEDRGIEHFVR